MEHHPKADDAGQATAPSAEHAETYLRHLADTELRRTLETPQHEPPGPTTERPPLAPAAQAVNPVRTAAGALIASGAIDESTAISVLGGLVEALMERSRLPPSNPYRSLAMPGLWRAMPTPGLPDRPIRLVPIGKPVLFADGSDEGRLLHLLTLALVPDWPPSATPAACPPEITLPRRAASPPTRSAHSARPARSAI